MSSVRFGIFALLAAGLMLGGCMRDYGSPNRQSASRGQTLHIVASSTETIHGLANMYGVEIKAIIDANNLSVGKLYPGQRLFIPGARPVVLPPPLPPAQPEALKPPLVPNEDWFVPRSAWAVEPIVVSRINPMGGKPNRITVHHSSMPGDTSSDSVSFLRLVDERHHGKIGSGGELGACIGYHFLIARDGTVYEGRPMKYQGAHSRGENNKLNIGVCLLGDFEDHQVPERMKAKLLEVLDRLRADYGISHSQVFGHKDFNPPGNYHTDCPGRFLFQVVQAYRRGQLSGDPERMTRPMATVRPAP